MKLKSIIVISIVLLLSVVCSLLVIYNNEYNKNDSIQSDVNKSIKENNDNIIKENIEEKNSSSNKDNSNKSSSKSNSSSNKTTNNSNKTSTNNLLNNSNSAQNKNNSVNTNKKITSNNKSNNSSNNNVSNKNVLSNENSNTGRELNKKEKDQQLWEKQKKEIISNGYYNDAFSKNELNKRLDNLMSYGYTPSYSPQCTKYETLGEMCGYHIDVFIVSSRVNKCIAPKDTSKVSYDDRGYVEYVNWKKNPNISIYNYLSSIGFDCSQVNDPYPI